MKITRQEIKHLANLSKIEFSEEEITKFEQELSTIVDFADQISNIDVSSVDFVSKTADFVSLREDVIEPSLSQEEILNNAPEQQSGGFAVPRVVEE